MKRRNFFKGILGTYAALSTYFSCKYFTSKEKQCIQTVYDLNIIRKIDIPVVRHYFREDTYCNDFLNFEPDYLISVEEFKKDIEHFANVMQKKVDKIAFFGSEPLLCGKILKIFEITRTFFPEAEIEVMTSGVLLEKQTEIFWETCARNNIGIHIVFYRTGQKLFDFDKITKIADNFKVKFCVGFPKFQGSVTNFKKNARANNFEKCRYRAAPILDGGKIYICSVINNAEKFLNDKKNNSGIHLAKDDVLDIYKISSADEIVKYLNEPKKMCSKCNRYKTIERQFLKECAQVKK